MGFMTKSSQIKQKLVDLNGIIYGVVNFEPVENVSSHRPLSDLTSCKPESKKVCIWSYFLWCFVKGGLHRMWKLHRCKLHSRAVDMIFESVFFAFGLIYNIIDKTLLYCIDRFPITLMWLCKVDARCYCHLASNVPSASKILSFFHLFDATQKLMSSYQWLTMLS